MPSRYSRRSFVLGTGVLVLASRNQAWGQAAGWSWSLPIRDAGGIPGDGFVVRHAFATENTWYNPGWWHTAEDWYRLDGAETAGADVRAVADGEVVFAGSDYPGRVVVVRHADDLFSMYGHLDYELPVGSGMVAQGDVLGTVLARTDGSAPSHLHFEVRRFVTAPDVNGSSPRYEAGCTLDCPPGPGYWPIDAPEHPVGMGWLNPTHVFGEMAFPDGVPDGAEVVVATGTPEMVPVWADPSAEAVGEIPVEPGERYSLVEVLAGEVDSAETGAEATHLWFRIRVPEMESPVWVRAAVPFDGDTGSDERASSLRFDWLPDG